MPSVHRTTCNRDCPDACSLLVTVEDGVPTALRGDPDDPVTRGFLCERTGRFLDRQASEERLTRPLLRRDGELRPVSWEQALDVAAARLLAIREQHGPEAILHYRSGGSLGILKVLADHLFEQFGPVAIKRGDICSGAGEAAQETDFGIADSHDLEDLLHSRVILVWGKNPHTSGVHLLPVLLEARRRGAVLLGVDPVRTKLADLCDVFLQPRPGADFDLAMGVARRLFERDWVDPQAGDYCDHLDSFRGLAHQRPVEDWACRADVDLADLDRLVELYGTRRPGALLVGWGLGRRRNGSTTVRALDALGAISGNLGVSGGGVSYYFGRRTAFDVDFVRGAEVAPRTLSEARLGQELLAADPPVHGVWVTAGNPVSMLPDSESVRRALSQTFTVVVDTHPTDTTEVAELVLPTLTLLEDDDVLGAYGNHWLRASRPALPPPQASGAPGGHAWTGDGPRHELAILQGLAQRLGVGPAVAGSVDDWKRRVTRRLEAAGAGLSALERGPVRNPLVERVLFGDRRFGTPSGRVNLLTEAALPAPVVDGDWPLTLLATSTPDAQSSQASRPVPTGPPEVAVHPDSASGLASGVVARLESAHGALTVVIRHDHRLRRDVALMAKGGMLRHGRCPNVLIAATETDAGGGAAYYDERVRLIPA